MAITTCSNARPRPPASAANRTCGPPTLKVEKTWRMRRGAAAPVSTAAPMSGAGRMHPDRLVDERRAVRRRRPAERRLDVRAVERREHRAGAQVAQAGGG